MNRISAESLLEYLPLAVLVIDHEDRIVLLNPRAEEWLGTSARFALSQRFQEYFGQEERFLNLLARARGQRITLSEYDFTLTMRDGGKHLVNVHMVPFEAQGLTMLSFARKQYAPAQRELENREEAVRASGLIAAMLAHEVKNPLSGIRGAAQLLMDELSPDKQDLARLICAEVDRIRDVLARVEPFSETEPAKLAAIDPHECLRYVRRLAQAGVAAGVEFTEEFDPSVAVVMADGNRLIQLLLNLVTNSAEALSGLPHARITLLTTSRQDFALMGPTGRIGRQAHLIVQDNGPGVAAELQERLFEPFVSGAAAQGRGLGLAIAAKLAADMGGLLSLEKTAPGCTRFRLTLRAAE